MKTLVVAGNYRQFRDAYGNDIIFIGTYWARHDLDDIEIRVNMQEFKRREK